MQTAVWTFSGSLRMFSLNMKSPHKNVIESGSGCRELIYFITAQNVPYFKNVIMYLAFVNSNKGVIYDAFVKYYLTSFTYKHGKTNNIVL